MSFRKIGTKKVIQEISEEYCDVCGETIKDDSVGDRLWISLEHKWSDSDSYAVCSSQCLCTLARCLFDGEKLPYSSFELMKGKPKKKEE